jgi:glutathione S-transferase
LLDFENREELHRRNFTAWKFRKNWKFKGSIMSVPRLYTYFRSGAAQRVRIGLELFADIYLAPQLYSARRFKVPFDHLRRITRVANLTDEHPAFRAAAPENQPDAE